MNLHKNESVGVITDVRYDGFRTEDIEKYSNCRATSITDCTDCRSSMAISYKTSDRTEWAQSDSNALSHSGDRVVLHSRIDDAPMIWSSGSTSSVRLKVYKSKDDVLTFEEHPYTGEMVYVSDTREVLLYGKSGWEVYALDVSKKPKTEHSELKELPLPPRPPRQLIQL